MEELTCFEVETKYKSGRTRKEILTFESEQTMWEHYDKHHNKKLVASSTIVDAWAA